MRQKRFGFIALWSVLALTCASNSEGPVVPSRTKGPADEGLKLVEPVYDRGFKGEWQDFGWSRREMKGETPARVDMSDYGGWIIARPGLSGVYDALMLRVRSARPIDFLSVALSAGKQGEFPDVKVAGKHMRQLEGGEVEVLVAMKELNPQGRTFDRVVLRANRPIPAGFIELDAIGLWGSTEAKRQADVAQAVATASRKVEVAIECDGASHPISDMIYGIAYYPMNDHKDQHVWSMNPAVRRWGGNHTTRYNWKLGNAWNTASDWFFKNVNYTPDPRFNWTDFLAADAQHGVKTALTLPTIGWVAKDTSSYSYPVSVFGKQKAVEPGQPDVGNGMNEAGKAIPPGPPSRTSIAMAPADIGAWVARIKERDQKAGGRSVHQYILDNEPDLWHVTHRDVHPEPASYDELLQRTVQYGTAVRKADPEAQIAGPASWGWTGYFFSAVDQVAGFQLKPDRRKHGDTPFLAWFLKELRSQEQRTGTRVLDVLDVHFYPQGDGIYGGSRTDPDTNARRFRATHALWDPVYRDESWINDAIELLPRFERMIADNYPGTKLSIGEWSFGAEKHMSGALAMAEALGRFGQSPVMASAYYWTYPPDQSPAYWAFRAFRNYDGKNAKFLEHSVATRDARDVSLFASRDSGKSKVVAVVLNSSNDAIEADIQTSTCGGVALARTFRMSELAPALAPAKPTREHLPGKPLVDVLPPGSITVYELAKGK